MLQLTLLVSSRHRRLEVTESLKSQPTAVASPSLYKDTMAGHKRLASLSQGDGMRQRLRVGPEGSWSGSWSAPGGQTKVRPRTTEKSIKNTPSQHSQNAHDQKIITEDDDDDDDR